MINFNSADVEFALDCEQLKANWIVKVAAKHNRKVGEINYLFCSDKYILEINKMYLNHNYYTDIITFDYSTETTIAGDIYISLDTVKDNADRFNTTLENEINRVIIHGVLHLCGQNDKSDKEQEQMTIKEDDALLILSGMS